MPSPKAVILLSGGLDSTTTLAIARHANFEPYVISFDYGQRNQIELEAARRVSHFFKVPQHLMVKVDLRAIGGSALTDNLAVPKGRAIDQMKTEIPVTYVPARNTIFLALALGWAETLPAYDIFIGVNALDYSGYPDCRPEFIQAFERMANLATRATETGQQYHIHTPLLHLSKAQIIERGLALGVDYRLTHSCYDPGPTGKACGSCDACLLRKHAFQIAGHPDPTIYQE
ncbi:7-cyano-7-deazaguanine synthase QueC [candidate division KSB1 bacterium]|nr:7-cyano-7-deazaguanine synthase QueC [candidate division KSB1 bacterium]